MNKIVQSVRVIVCCVPTPSSNTAAIAGGVSADVVAVAIIVGVVLHRRRITGTGAGQVQIRKKSVEQVDRKFSVDTQVVQKAEGPDDASEL